MLFVNMILLSKRKNVRIFMMHLSFYVVSVTYAVNLCPNCDNYVEVQTIYAKGAYWS